MNKEEKLRERELLLDEEVMEKETIFDPASQLAKFSTTSLKAELRRRKKERYKGGRR